MNNVIQLAPRPGSKLALDVADSVRFCLTLAATYPSRSSRLQGMEIMLKHCLHAQHVRQALGTQSEIEAALESYAAEYARIKRQDKPVADTAKQPQSRVLQFKANCTDKQP